MQAGTSQSFSQNGGFDDGDDLMTNQGESTSSSSSCESDEDEEEEVERTEGRPSYQVYKSDIVIVSDLKQIIGDRSTRKLLKKYIKKLTTRLQSQCSREYILEACKIMRTHGVEVQFHYEHDLYGLMRINAYHLEIFGKPTVNLRDLLYDLGEFERGMCEAIAFITAFKYDFYTEAPNSLIVFNARFLQKLHTASLHHDWDELGRVIGTEPSLRYVVRRHSGRNQSLDLSRVRNKFVKEVVARQTLTIAGFFAALQRAVTSKVTTPAKGAFILQNTLFHTKTAILLPEASSLALSFIFDAAMTLLMLHDFDSVKQLTDLHKYGIIKKDVKYFQIIRLFHQHFTDNHMSEYDARELLDNLFDCVCELDYRPETELLVDIGLSTYFREGLITDEDSAILFITEHTDNERLTNLILMALQKCDLGFNLKGIEREVSLSTTPTVHCAEQSWVSWAEIRLERNDVSSTIEVIKAMFQFLDYAENRKNWRAWRNLQSGFEKSNTCDWIGLWKNDRDSWWPIFHSIDHDDSMESKFQKETMTFLKNLSQ